MHGITIRHINTLAREVQRSIHIVVGLLLYTDIQTMNAIQDKVMCTLNSIHGRRSGGYSESTLCEVFTVGGVM